tara:strand:+ start:60 stop:296 length:237 start_codon:yes stop_codon:yes gene_type:complete
MAISRSSIGKEIKMAGKKRVGLKRGGQPKLGSGARFKKLTSKLKQQGAKNPKALAAAIGRKKFGAKKMAAMAKRGRKA